MRDNKEQGRIRVLIADPQELLASTIAFVMERDGYRVDTRTSISLKLLPRRYDLMIIDPAIDGLDGSKGIAALRRLNPQAQIIVMQDQVTGALSSDLLLAGVNGAISRTMPVREFLETIGYLMCGSGGIAQAGWESRSQKPGWWIEPMLQSDGSLQSPAAARFRN